jgi:hypothetical protein
VNRWLIPSPVQGLQLPDEIIVDPGVTVREDDSGATMDAEEVVVEGVGKLGLSH